MVVGRITTRIARTVVNRYQTLHSRLGYHLSISNPRFHFHSVTASSHNEVISGQLLQLHNASLSSSTFQRFGFSSSASPDPNKKKTSENRGEKELTFEDRHKLLTHMTKHLARKGEPWKTIVPDLSKLIDNMMWSSNDMDNMENITSRANRDSKKCSIQIFPMSLLDVADDADKASSVLKRSIAKIDSSTDSARDVPILKLFLESTEMLKIDLSEHFKKYGVEKYDPMNEEFDPNRHNAVFHVTDPTKMPNTVAVVLKRDTQWMIKFYDLLKLV